MSKAPHIDIIPLTVSRLEEARCFLRELLLKEFQMEARLKEMDDLSQSYHMGNGSFWIAVHRSTDSVVGCVGLLDMGEGRGYLKRMYLALEYRAIGLGKRLLLALLDHARAKNMRQVYLATDYCMDTAQRFYEHHGFHRIEQLPPDLDSFGDPIFYVTNLQLAERTQPFPKENCLCNG